MFGLGLPEIALIALGLGVLFFGGPKIVEIARSLGRVKGEFKKGKQEVENEMKKAEEDAMKGDSMAKKK